MQINISDTQKDLPLKHEKKKIKQIIETVVALENSSFDEVSVSFISDAKMKKMHDDFFQDPSSTDCISFPMDSKDDVGYKILGEIYVCPMTAIDYAKQHGLDPYRETTLYIVHGILHLLGYDDIHSADRKIMRKKEKTAMDLLAKQRYILTP